MCESTVALIVTYNRKELLKECLNAVFSQTLSVDKVILIDNASTDGTVEMLEKEGFMQKTCFEYIRMHSNTGGSGGFYHGMQQALKQKYEWVWIMDDDTIPERDCLEKLHVARNFLQKKNEKFSFLASSIFGPEQEAMNVPAINMKPSSNGYSNWYKYLANDMVSISRATFVSLLIRKDAMKKCGLPCKDYFLWGDDTEYTNRLVRHYGEAYFVGTSKAIHKRYNAQKLNIDQEKNENRLKLFKFYYRNELINIGLYNRKRAMYVHFFENMKKVMSYTLTMKFKKAKVIFIGSFAALIQYSKFEKYIKEQINE